VDVCTVVGHSAVRHYVMGDECQGRAATPEEIDAMRGIVRDAIQAGALGLSVSRNRGHYDPQGTLIPALWAEEDEIFALGDVLRELGTGLIQSGGGRDAELKNRLMSRLSEATGRTVVYNNLGQTARKPDEWKQLMALVDESSQAGIRAYPLCTPNSTTQLFTMRNCQLFRGSPTWHPILLASDADKLRPSSAVRTTLIKQRCQKSSTIPTPLSASPMAGRTCSSTAAMGIAPASWDTGCASSRSCPWSMRYAA